MAAGEASIFFSYHGTRWFMDTVSFLINHVTNFCEGLHVRPYRHKENGVLYCIVVGSRRPMPPDALQPKAYCTNPGL